MRLVAAIISLA